MKRGDWFVLKMGNDWGSDYLAREPLQMRPCMRSEIKNGVETPAVTATYGTADGGRAYRLDDGETLRVRLPNGDERDGVVRIRTTHGTVSDHGHEYATQSRVPVVAFADGTEVSLQVAAIPYEPERDPTADEVAP